MKDPSISLISGHFYIILNFIMSTGQKILNCSTVFTQEHLKMCLFNTNFNTNGKYCLELQIMVALWN